MNEILLTGTLSLNSIKTSGINHKLKLHTIKSGWSIVYIEGSKVIISKNNVFLSLK